MVEDYNHYDDHYASKSIQPIEVMQMLLSPEEFIGFLKGNIIKYTSRAGTKVGESFEKDKAKAERYKYWLDQALAGKTINPRI